MVSIPVSVSAIMTLMRLGALRELPAGVEPDRQQIAAALVALIRKLETG